MFFGKKKSNQKFCHSPYSQYVGNKIIPNLATQRETILSTAEKCFPKGFGEIAAQRALVKHGHAISQMIAVSIAVNIQNELNRELKDIEYADCALLAQFIMRIPLCKHEEAIDEIVTEWMTEFETDIQYLIFCPDEEIVDLVETGNDYYVGYESNSEANMPDAYFFILAKIISQRQNGEYEPYKMLNHTWVPDMRILGALQSHWQEMEVMMSHWLELVQIIQELAHENESEIWEWW